MKKITLLFLLTFCFIFCSTSTHASTITFGLFDEYGQVQNFKEHVNTILEDYIDSLTKTSSTFLENLQSTLVPSMFLNINILDIINKTYKTHITIYLKELNKYKTEITGADVHYEKHTKYYLNDSGNVKDG